MSSTPKSPQPPVNRRIAVLLLAIAAGVLLLDQLTKVWALAALDVGDPPVPLVGDLLSLRLLFNPGAALSIGTGMTWVLTVVVVAIVTVLLVMVRKIHSRVWAITLGMLLGGALGNLVDRLARQPGFGRGHVVDFIDYAGFFVGNVADIAIVAAAVLIGVLSVRGIGLDGRRVSSGETTENSEDSGSSEGEVTHSDPVDATPSGADLDVAAAEGPDPEDSQSADSKIENPDTSGRTE